MMTFKAVQNGKTSTKLAPSVCLKGSFGSLSFHVNNFKIPYFLWKQDNMSVAKKGFFFTLPRLLSELYQYIGC
jgi:hypothetical protein